MTITQAKAKADRITARTGQETFVIFDIEEETYVVVCSYDLDTWYLGVPIYHCGMEYSK